ncbi:hypothetical protein EVAR_72533_1, partial [Eumeta japonica]
MNVKYVGERGIGTLMLRFIANTFRISWECYTTEHNPTAGHKLKEIKEL